MATRFSIATGNFTTAGTWGVCDATMENDSVAANAALTTSYVGSTGTTPGAITITHIGVKIASIAASPTGTMSIELYNNTGAASVAGTETTINVSDIPVPDLTTNGGAGWYFFKLAAPVALAAATSYSVRGKTSSSSQVNLYSSATTNWSRQIVTSTTGAPGSGDKLYIGGEWTAAATYSAFTVTMENTATTAFGNIAVCNKGLLKYAYAAATNYYLKCQDIEVHPGAVYWIGDTTNPIPSGSTAVVEFNSASAGQYGLFIRHNSEFKVHGYDRAVPMRKALTATITAGTTTANVANATDWAVGDTVAFPSSSTTTTQFISKDIATIPGSTSFTWSGTLTNVKDGSGDYICQVMNLTRNVIFRGMSVSNVGHITVTGSPTTCDVRWCRLTWMGTSTSTRHAFSIRNTTGLMTAMTAYLEGVAIDNNTNGHGFFCDQTLWTSIELDNICIYNMAGNSGIWWQSANTAGTITLNNIYVNGATFGARVQPYQLTATDIRCASCSSGGFLTVSNTNQTSSTLISVTDVVSHSCGTTGGVGITATPYVRATNILVWRNGSGLALSGNSLQGNGNVIIDGVTTYANGTSAMELTGQFSGLVIVKNLLMYPGTSAATAVGIRPGSTFSGEVEFRDCDWTVTTLIQLQSSVAGFIRFINTALTVTTELSLNTYNLFNWKWENCSISFINYDNVAGSIRTYLANGRLDTDTSIKRTGAQSLRLTPSSALYKSFIADFPVPVASGDTATVTAYVRKSVVGDGTAYNGSQPRLMVRANPAIGINDDTVIDTSTAAGDGAWEALTGASPTVTGDGVLQFYVDCDGTTGWVNVDDMSTTQAEDTSSLDFWNGPTPQLSMTAGGGGGGDTENAYVGV